MARIMGIGIGVVWLGLAFAAFQRSQAGWDAGFSDVGFWWAVITAFLTIAALSAIVGTWLHTGSSRG